MLEVVEILEQYGFSEELKIYIALHITLVKRQKRET
jgi:hypothetical protein